MNKSNLAPIILFVYNRPKHTRQTLEALKWNELADQSSLFIYADGPKPNASNEDLKKINEVREVIREKQWCKAIEIIERDENLGLAGSIKKGITEVVNEYGKIIVIEDDIVTSQKFLSFLNTNLVRFENTEFIAGVTGDSRIKDYIEKDGFLLSRTGSIWGWGTWDRVWKSTEFNAQKLKNQILQSDEIDTFNFGEDYLSMLENQIQAKIDSWGICFYSSYFIQKQFFVSSTQSLIKNIGKDGSGTHYNKKPRLRFIKNVYKKIFN